VILQILKISEHSLYPDYRDGDFVFISKIPILLRGARVGDAVVFEHPSRGRLIKLVERVLDGGQSLWVVGLSADSLDSRAFGPVPVRQVLGKVVWCVSSK
jgi:type IV secretory pathway protease TraF